MYLKLVLITCVLAFVAVVFSAFARLSDAGLGCTDWPACYKENALKQRQPPKADVSRDHTSWQWKLQNLVGALLGILAIAICGHAWQKRGTLRQSPLLPTLLVLLIGFLAVFGILAFSYLPRAVIVLIHLAGGMTMLMMLTWIALSLTEPAESSAGGTANLRAFAGIGLVLIIVEIMLGGWVSSNFAALACDGFPLCRGKLLPSMDFSYSLENTGLPLSAESLTAIHWMHRAGALLVLAYLVWLSFRSMAAHTLNRIGKFMLALVIFQFVLGAFNVLTGFPLAGAVMHNAVAMLLLVALVVLYYRTRARKEG